MDAIKGTMTEIYNDLSKSTSGNTIAEVSVWESGDQIIAMTLHVEIHLPECASGFQIRRLRIEIEKLQWLHQQELSEMKHNLGETLNIPWIQSSLCLFL